MRIDILKLIPNVLRPKMVGYLLDSIPSGLIFSIRVDLKFSGKFILEEEYEGSNYLVIRILKYNFHLISIYRWQNSNMIVLYPPKLTDVFEN